METVIPVQVPGYEILGELGRGGMGVVYKARQIKLDRVVALKMILAGGHAGEAELARFRAEAEAVARLQHPNIVQIFEVGEHGGLPFFSLEFCGGGSLDKKLAGTPLPPKEAAALVATLARAVQTAHEKGVIHRDLKPANILLTEDGTPKITDFGLAKRLDADAGQTRTGSVMGTPSYMAPEQAGGKTAEMGPLCDVYALGAILYELLTGRPPFRAATPLDTMMQVVSDDPVPPRHLQPRTPHDLETICLKCLRKERGKRYASAAALAEDLRRFLAGEPVKARPMGLMGRTAKWVRRRPAVAALLAAVAAVAAAGFAGISWQYGEAARERDNARAEAGNVRTAQKIAEEAKEKAQDAKTAALRQAAESTLRRGLQLCEQGEIPLGLLWTARGLALAHEAGADDLEDAARWNLGAWSRELHAVALVLPHPGTTVSGVAYSPDGKLLATGCQDGMVRLWDADMGQPVGEPRDAKSAVITLAFDPSGRKLAACCEDGVLRLWDTVASKPPMAIRFQTGPCPGSIRPGIAFTSDGELLAIGAVGPSVGVWDVASGQPHGPRLRHGGQYAAGVAFAPASHRLLIANASSWRVQLWDVDAGKPVGPMIFTEGGASSAAFSPDGKSFLTAQVPGGFVQIWNTETGQPVGPHLKHNSAICYGAAYSKDGKRILSWARTTVPASGTPRPGRRSAPHYCRTLLSKPRRLARTARPWRQRRRTARASGSLRKAPCIGRLIKAARCMVSRSIPAVRSYYSASTRTTRGRGRQGMSGVLILAPAGRSRPFIRVILLIASTT